MRNSVQGAGILIALSVLVSGCTTTSVNHPPTISSADPRGDTRMPEEGTLGFSLNSTDRDGQNLVCRWYVDGVLAATTEKPFSFLYSPGRAVGEHLVSAVVSDGSLTALRVWRVEVFRVNHPPVMVVGPPGRGPVSVPEGGSLAFGVNVSDPDGDRLTLDWKLDGATVLVNRTSYLFEPGYTMAGMHTVIISAGDGNLTSEEAWNVTVTDVNRAPRITEWRPPMDSLRLSELGSQEFWAAAVDDDGDAVSYLWSLDGAPAGTGQSWNYTTDYFSAGDHAVAVTVGDGSLESSGTWTVWVDNLNRPPRFTAFSPGGNATTSEYEALPLSVVAEDDDGDRLSVNWYIDGAAVSSGTGEAFNYTPGYNSVGDHVVRAELTDGAGDAARSWNVSVTRAVANWTVLAYMSADNDLEPYLIEDLNEMEMVGSTPRVNIVAQLDRHPGYDGSNGDWSGTRRYRVEPDKDSRVIGSRLLEDLGEKNMGDLSTFQDFLLWGAEKFPAQRYQLVLSGHGDGWGGISQDFTDGNDKLAVGEVAAGLRAFSSARNGTPAEVLELDVCYWALLETDWALRDLASYIVASEDIDPSAGQSYNLYLEHLVAEPEMTARNLSIQLIEAFRTGYAEGGFWPEDNDTYTQSAVETAGLAALAEALDRFNGLVIGDIGAQARAISAARSGVETYGKPDYMDLHDFLRLLRLGSTQSDLNDSIDAVTAAIGRAVVAEAHGTFRPNSAGISIYFPARSYSYKAAYGELDFSRENGWNGLLKAYYNITGRAADGRVAKEQPGAAPPAPGPVPLSVSERKILNAPKRNCKMFTVQGGLNNG